MLKHIIFIGLFFVLLACTQKMPENASTMQSSSTPKNVTRANIGKSYIEYNDWILVREKNQCFIASFPISSAGDFFDREANYMLLSLNKQSKMVEIVIIGGGVYKVDSFVRIQVEDTSFLLNVNDTQAWASDESKVIEKMLTVKEPSFLVFSTFSEKDAKIIDKYSLIGFKNAYKELQLKCNRSII